MVLEICPDASITRYPDGRTFGCSGAYAIQTDMQVYYISPDTTSNRSEVLGVYAGVKLADTIRRERPEFDEFIIYSDSQFAIYGLTKWLSDWIKNSKKGIMYGSNGKPVKNQELFILIAKYLVDNNLRVQFRHCKGHTAITNKMSLQKASEVFEKSNGYWPRPEEVYKISYYNNIVDNTSREKLQYIDPNVYPKYNYGNLNNITNKTLLVPPNYKEYIF